MIDIHSHLIYGVDDGPPTIKDSIRMVLEAERMGVKTIIATPHFHKGIFFAENVSEHFEELKSRVKGCGVELLLGSEVFFNSIVPDVIEFKEKYTLNKSKFLLFELPFDVMPSNVTDIILNLHMNNLVPVLAHPERSRFLCSNFRKFTELIEAGCLIQLDAASILGVYGRESKRFAKYLIKANLVHFIASDAHCASDYNDWYLAAYRKVKKWAGKEYTDSLFYKNQSMILGIKTNGTL